MRIDYFSPYEQTSRKEVQEIDLIMIVYEKMIFPYLS